MSYPQPYPQQVSQQVPAGPVPLWAPLYGASIGEAATRFWKKYATFSGGASRSEYWWWTLISVGISVILQIMVNAGTIPRSSSVDAATVGPIDVVALILLAVFALAAIVPSLALMARRLHDANLSAWLILLILVPIFGGVAVLVMTILPTNPAGQRFDRPVGGAPVYPGV
jgi:uncharacterized membrane protein YhaH (DUF805 family)